MVNKHVLTIDVGNSRVKFGEFQHQKDGMDAAVTPVEITAVSLRHRRDVATQLADWAAGRQITSCIVAGSNPPIRDQLTENWPAQLPVPLVFASPHSIPLRLDVDQPEAVGIDRVLNAWAARHRYPGRSAIVVDSGTTTTVDLVSAEGAFQGGTIFPGLRLSAYALHDYTARLPLIDVDSRLHELPHVPGRNTDEAMRAGLYWGQLGAIREIVAQLRNTVAPDVPALLLTGGGSRHLHRHFREGEWIDSLPLHGLAMLAAESTP